MGPLCPFVTFCDLVGEGTHRHWYRLSKTTLGLLGLRMFFRSVFFFFFCVVWDVWVNRFAGELFQNLYRHRLNVTGWTRQVEDHRALRHHACPPLHTTIAFCIAKNYQYPLLAFFGEVSGRDNLRAHYRGWVNRGLLNRRVKIDVGSTAFEEGALLRLKLSLVASLCGAVVLHHAAQQRRGVLLRSWLLGGPRRPSRKGGLGHAEGWKWARTQKRERVSCAHNSKRSGAEASVVKYGPMLSILWNMVDFDSNFLLST